MALKVVETSKPESGMGTDTMTVTIEGNTIDEVLSNDSKRMAYEERKKHGMHAAGIEGAGGPFPVDVKTGQPVPSNGMAEISKRPADIKYRITFKLTQGII